MEWVEVTGKTVDEAREKALDLLGVADDEADVEVLAEAKMGLFGRVREEARVRARILPSVPRAKDDGRRRRGRPAKEAAAVAAPPVGDSTPDPLPSERRRSGPGERPRRGSGGPGERRTSRPSSSGERREQGRASVAGAEDVRMVSTMTDNPVAERPDVAGDAVEVPVAEQAQVAKRFVDGLLSIMGAEGASSVVVQVDEDTAELQVTGQDLGLLIGPKGATLLALQDLARTVVQRQTGARTGRLLLDVAGYRQKRREALERFTQKVASEVVATGTATALEPMSSADRKVVHDTVNTIDGVTTTSEGEDPRRRVVVRPA